MSELQGSKNILTLIRNRVRRFFHDFGLFLKNVLVLFKQNFKEVMLFILICSAFTMTATSALKAVLVDSMMNAAGVTYIVPANLQQVFLSPASILMMIVFAIMVTFMSLFEIAGLLHAFSMAQANRETNLPSIFYAGFRACRKALHPRNWLLTVFILVLFPLTKVLPLSSSTFKLILPGFVDQTIDYTKSLTVLYDVVYIILILGLVVYLFSINSFVMQKNTFFRSCRESRMIGKGHYIETFLTLALLTVIVNFVINSLSSVIVVNWNELVNMFTGNNKNVVFKSEAVGTYTYVLRQFLKSYISPAVNNAALAVLFYRYIDEKDMLATLDERTFKFRKPSMKIVITFMAALTLFFVASGIYLLDRYSFLFDDVERPLVCAHRGDNVNAPENTMPAFELAASENLEWIELDVHQTSDGIIVCNHDSSIKRVTGQNLSIHDHTYEELTRYEMGSWMPGNYEHVVVPTLEEVLTFAKGNGMHVQVELKGHAEDKHFEENVLKVINETGMHDDVMVIAQDASRLQRMMQLDPSLTQAYCVFIGLGHLEDIEYSDNISMEESYVTPEMVRRLHAEGKKVFCWTVDKDDTVQYLVSCGVDVIGTDNPMLISNAVEKADCSGGFMRIFHIVMHIVADMDK
ncbi:MAG: glycerophosphoryl diester phosphodiesterase membrane domain-containing protein [Lachnospiraceae bacterium]|nr:glycerophosphoryl diester phosphodiesterase membrane domain-containing protein [Lachnospiraceae bacterium]